MSKTILVVDDSDCMRQMVTFSLKREGFDVVEAEDGKDALNKLIGSCANMIITDLNMPNVNGLEFIRVVRDTPGFKYIPIVVLTTETLISKKLKCKSAGATGWITKPFKHDQLIGVIKKLMP